MSKAKAVACLLLAVFFRISPTRVFGGDAEIPGEPPRTVDVPSEEFPTIQGAIAALPDRSTVMLGPGVYSETLSISRKRISIVGRDVSRSTPTIISGANREEAVITYGPGGGGTVENVMIRDGAVGIKGEAWVDEEGRRVPPRGVLVRESHILQVGQGIFGCFSSLTVEGCFIHHVDWSAVTVLESDSTILFNDIIADTEGVGILLFNAVGEGTLRVSYTHFQFNLQGGLAIVGDAKDIEIDHCTFLNNRIFGMLLLDVGQAAVTASDVDVVHKGPVPGFSSEFGDGLVTACLGSEGDVLVDGCSFRRCDRVGVLFMQCGGLIQSTDCKFNKYGVVLEGTVHPELGDGIVYLGNAKEDLVTDGDLPVPNEPMPVPEEPD